MEPFNDKKAKDLGLPSLSPYGKNVTTLTSRRTLLLPTSSPSKLHQEVTRITWLTIPLSYYLFDTADQFCRVNPCLSLPPLHSSRNHLSVHNSYVSCSNTHCLFYLTSPDICSIRISCRAPPFLACFSTVVLAFSLSIYRKL